MWRKLDIHDKSNYTLDGPELNDPPLEAIHVSTSLSNAKISERLDRCAHLIQGGTPVAEAMREAGYREAIIEAEAEANTIVETYPAQKGVKVTGGRRRGKATGGDAGAAEFTG